MKLHLVKKKTEAPGVISFIFKPAEPMTWKAGQFSHYVLRHAPTDDRGSDRYFTIATAPLEKMAMITTRFASDKGSSFKKTLKSLKIGGTIETSGVSGDFIVEDPKKQYVFIAGGIGITPFRSILKDLEQKKKRVAITLLYANRDRNIIYKNELEAFAKHNPNLTIRYVTAPDHIDVAKIKEFVPDMQKPQFYISGPEPMVESLGKALTDAGVPASHMKQDFFPGYHSV